MFFFAFLWAWALVSVRQSAVGEKMATEGPGPGEVAAV